MAYEYTFKITSKDSNAEAMNSNVGNASSTTSIKPKLESGNNQSATSGLVQAMVINQGKKIAMYSVGKVGVLTGDSNLQQDINNKIEAVSLGIMTATNPAMAIATISFNLGTTALENYIENRKMNIQQKQRLAIAGYNDVGDIIGRKH